MSESSEIRTPLSSCRFAIGLSRRLPALFLIAVPLNYLWELAQSDLYLPPSRLSAMWWHCFVASLGDGLLVCLIYVACSIVFRQPNWNARMSASRYAAIFAIGLVIGVLIEWTGLQLHRWAYAEAMPLVPLLHIGLVPVVQMLVLPALVFWIAKAWAAATSNGRVGTSYR